MADDESAAAVATEEPAATPELEAAPGHDPLLHRGLEHTHPSPVKYVGIAILLAIITALEVGLYYMNMPSGLLVSFLLVRAPIMALMFTITFPIGVAGARRAGITVAAVAALINIVWSASVLAGPLLAGLIAQTVGNRLAFVLLSAASLASAAWIMNGNRRESAALACGASSRAR